MGDFHSICHEALALLEAIGPRDRVLHIARDDRTAEGLAAFLRDVLPDRRVLFMPPWDCLPFDGASPTADAMGRRMSALCRLQDPEPGDILLTDLATLMQRLPPRAALQGRTIGCGDALDPDAFESFALGVGYDIDDRIDEPGELAIRGATIEIFAAGRDMPCRIELTEGVVTALREFDPVTQRSTGDIDRIRIMPVSELPAGAEGRTRGAEHALSKAWDGLTLLPDHMQGARLTALGDTLDLADKRLMRLQEAHDEAEADGAHPLAVDALYLGPQEWAGLAADVHVLRAGEGRPVPSFASASRPRAQLARFLDSEAVTRRVVFVAAAEAEVARITRMATQGGMSPPERVQAWHETRDHPRAILRADLAQGAIRDDVVVVTGQDLLGSRLRSDTTARAVQILGLGALELGDIVVHEDHGLARLEALEPLDPDNPTREAIRLSFAQDERLLVPTHDAGKIWRYGSARAGVKMDRLRGSAWARRRTATSEALLRLADGLVALARTRQAATAPKLVPPPRDFERFIRRFPFQPTPDQAAAIDAVLADMASGRPMDRLVIGDVGFGKTEIALRAAAAAALSGRQVAICAPTTVLARQHFQTFRQRFAPFGIEVGHVSRLVTGKQAAATRAGLADGSVRVAVGTHALLSKTIAFADLGLLVIDEEQRFGAAQKKGLRALGQGVHVMSMTATPIPQSLQGALMGLQDVSPLMTPPARRRPIRTVIADDQDATLRRALLREHRRGGQSFVVVPRIEDIEAVHERLLRLVPDLKLQVAHGDLSPRRIDEVMVGFAAGQGDVLLATGIIESGLDVTRANTMIIMRPALFGLAQLHQMRGRVGRGAVQAYCHLLSPESEALSDEARKRLGMLQAMDNLGAGLAISAADLDQRGAGDLLGDRQAGHVQKVGLGLYQWMLEQAMRRAKGQADLPHPPRVPGELGHICPDYIPEPENRIDLYHRLARAAEPAGVDRLADEIADRFGTPPEPVATLLNAANLRALGATLGVESLSIGPQGVSVYFHARPDPDDLPPCPPELGAWDIRDNCLTLHRSGQENSLALAGSLLERLA